jgi:hypothetical protein
MFARMRDAVGAAASIAAREFLARDERAAIRAWLTPLEAMTRKVVLIHALALAERGDLRARSPKPAFAAAPPATPPRPAPAVTLIALPQPSVRILAAAPAAPPPSARPRAPSLRLWPRPRWAGPRVRDLGANTLVRDALCERARLAAARRLKAARTRRAPESQRLARRIDALARILDRPLAAARRLARQLYAKPLLALRLAARRLPRTTRYREPEYSDCYGRAYESAYAFNLKPRDTS